MLWAGALPERRRGGGGAGGLPVIEVNQDQSQIITVSIPDDDIAHGCNKLIVYVQSLRPDLYRTLPYTRGQGFEYVVYLDNDGGNPGASTEGRGV